jgi:hypothetical protein
VHLMGRGPHGAICEWTVEDTEQRADRLALELLAPARAAAEELRRILGPRFEDLRRHLDEGAEVLASRFGLPQRVARSYCDLLASRHRARPSLTDRLLGGG